MENQIIFELGNWKLTSIEYIEFRYEPTWTPFGVSIELHIVIKFEHFKYIQDIQNEKFKIHKNNVCFNGCIFKCIDYTNYYLNISLKVDNIIKYDTNPIFKKYKRKLKISDILDTM
jgi:hypothetical protein